MFTLKRKLFLIPLLGLLFGAVAALAFVNPYSGAISLSELTLQLSGSRGEFQLGFGVVELVELTLRWVPMFVFEMYLGAELYRFFCTASVYIFSRTPRRLSWYAKENAALLLCGLLYQAAYLAGAVIVTSLRYALVPDSPGGVILLSHLAIYTLWTCAFTLLVNLLSILLGSGSAYLIAAGVQLAGISLLSALRLVQDDPARMGRLMGLNPAAHLVLGWHSSADPSVQAALHSPYPGPSLGESVLLTAVLWGTVTIIGAFLVKRRDLLTSNAEMEAY